MHPEINQNINICVTGHFTLTAVKSDGSGSRELASFKNLILDNGLNALCSNQQTPPNNLIAYCRVGSGSTAPVASQSALVSQLASVTSPSSTTNYSTSTPYSASRTNVWRFGEGVAAGNISEIGVGWSASGNTLFSRALVLDALGNPTTVTVLSDEFLDVTYTLTLYLSVDDSLTTLNINGTSHEVRSRLAGAGTSAVLGASTTNFLNAGIFGGFVAGYVGQGSLGAITGSPSGTQTSVTVTGAAVTYVSGTFYTECDISLGLTQANLSGGFTTLHIRPSYFAAHQISFTPAIPKTSSQIFTIRFRVSFTRA